MTAARTRRPSTSSAARLSRTSGRPAVVAVTSGCCSPDPATDAPRLLLYDQRADLWYSRLVAYTAGAAPGSDTVRDAHPRQSLADSY